MEATTPVESQKQVKNSCRISKQMKSAARLIASSFNPFLYHQLLFETVNFHLIDQKNLVISNLKITQFEQ